MKIVILGAGNLAIHLVKAWKSTEIKVIQIYNRSKAKAEKAFFDEDIDITDDLSALKQATAYIIAISDQAIETISSRILVNPKAMLVHVSGAMPILALKGDYRKGVLYPLQSFSVNTQVDYKKIPFFIEADDLEGCKLLGVMAKSISPTFFSISSAERLQLHTAAVWASNFPNHMLYQAKKIGDRNNIPFSVFFPLIQTTFEKAMRITPYDAQTGPARRDDLKTIEKHIEAIKEDPYATVLYEMITESIRKTYQNKELNQK